MVHQVKVWRSGVVTAVTCVQSLTQELLYAMGVAKKKKTLGIITDGAK